MSHLDPDILPLVALGEQELTADDRAHLEECPVCAEEVDALKRTAVVGRSTIVIDALESPPPRVWDAIVDELGMSPGATASTADDATVSASEEAPAQTRREHVARTRDRAPRRRAGGLTRGLLALAATVVLVVVVGGVWSLTSLPQTTPIASAELLAFPDHPGAHGEAVVEERGDERTVEVTLEAAPIPGTFREVWLISADATQIVSLGVLDSQTGTFPIPADIDLDEFVLVDVSAEPDDGPPEHSGDSIVRGELQRI
ncbi:anti-sigma factor [Microbacterium schleiferi]|uniref:Anti-sigma factor n=1 Tax=Microbacterium schleiferi TaxID=69362 RepID=A0A7S8MVU6_9MICO|nr:anti-sigma factor [Microbacterium schleiferi]QPE03628.1 anti-sigma factor [Microbacterium schleiferi]